MDAVLVTGGAKRIGRAVARRFAKAGWAVVVHHHRSASEATALVEELHAAGAQAGAVSGDLSSEAGVRAVLDAAMRSAPGLRCVVNNAALFRYDDPAKFSIPLFQEHLAVNALAPLVFARELFARAAAEDRYVLINILDQKLYNPNPDFFSYTLSKALLQAATPLLGMALAPRVRVANVAPGLALLSGEQTPENFERVHAGNPMGAGTLPEEIAEAIYFAAVNPAIHGATLVVDHGQHLWKTSRDVMFL